MSNYPVGTTLQEWTGMPPSAQDCWLVVTGSLPNCYGEQDYLIATTRGGGAWGPGCLPGRDLDVPRGRYRVTPLPPSIQPWVPVAAPQSPPSVPIAWPSAPVAAASNTAATQSTWKIGDMFTYSGWGGKDRVHQVCAYIADNRWKCDEFDTKARVWLGPQRTHWYLFDVDPEIKKVADVSIPDSPLLRRGGTVPTMPVKHSPYGIGLNAAIAQDLGAKLKAKPPGMPNACYQCGNAMSASLDCYYGSTDAIGISSGADLVFVSPASLCTKCRPRRC